MVTKNKIYCSGFSLQIATGTFYTIKDDEVFINNNPYKIRNGHLRSLPADFSKFNEWEIDDVKQTNLIELLDNIWNCISTSSGSSNTNPPVVPLGIFNNQFNSIFI